MQTTYMCDLLGLLADLLIDVHLDCPMNVGVQSLGRLAGVLYFSIFK